MSCGLSLMEYRYFIDKVAIILYVIITNGDVGYRSPYLLHAKRTLYHMTYIPISSVIYTK